MTSGSARSTHPARGCQGTAPATSDKEKDDGFQSVLANVTISVDLPKHYRGTPHEPAGGNRFQMEPEALGGHDLKLILQQVIGKARRRSRPTLR